jgi:hypothetical protein
MLRRLEIRADAIVRPSVAAESFFAAFAIKPGEPGFSRISLAVLEAFNEERDRIEGRSDEPPSGLTLTEVCCQAALNMDATIREEIQ